MEAGPNLRWNCGTEAALVLAERLLKVPGFYNLKGFCIAHCSTLWYYGTVLRHTCLQLGSGGNTATIEPFLIGKFLI